MKFRTSILNHYNVLPGPWRGTEFKRRQAYVREAFEDSLFIAISGPIGNGKTELVGEVARELSLKVDHQVVWLHSKANDKLHISTIIRAFIGEISDEGARRDTEAAARQLTRLLGLRVVDQKKKITLVIDDAQELHANTINGLKRLRELDFLGQRELFGVVLIGQPKLTDKLKSQILRESAVRMEVDLMDEAHGWMHRQMREQYIKERWNNLLNRFQLDQTAAVIKTPASIDQFIYDRMKIAYNRGEASLNDKDFVLDIRTLRESLGLSQSQLGSEVGLHKSTISQIETGQYQDPTTKQKVQSKIAELMQKHKEKAAKVAS
jgi:type II secretory pathway predicted ATPase ExeA